MKRFPLKKKYQAALFFLLTGTLFSQEALKSTEEEYYDFLSLQGITSRPSLNYRTLSDSVWNIGTETKTVTDEDGTETTEEQPLFHPWQGNNLGRLRVLWQPEEPSKNGYLRGVPQGVFLKWYGPEWYNSFNTASPYGQNDGALWQGKGYNTRLTAGARLEAYGLEVTVKPQVSFSQNLGFDFLPGVYGSEYSYFWKGNIDLVQRYGDTPFWTFDWGDTEIRYTWRTLTVGFGTQSPWLGPAWLNPMLGSNNAPTYPKFDIGLRKTSIRIPKLGWYIGDIEGRIWLGKLSESNYFDNESSNDERQLTGFSAAYSPSFLPGFTIGLNKICINYWKDKSIKYLNPFYDNNDQTVPEDQKMSIFINWIFPQVGFEVYGELGIDDYSWNKLSNPFHTAIYTLGAKKTLTISKKHHIHLEIIGEWNNFEMSQDFQLQWPYMGYYSHGGIAQGYTQRGQILGAGSGYFGNSQYLGLRVYHPKGNIIAYLHFNRPDTNYINNLAVDSSRDDWKDDSTRQHEQWACYKSIRTIGMNAQYFITKSFLAGGEFNSSWIIFPKYHKDKDDSYMNCYISLYLKYSF